MIESMTGYGKSVIATEKKSITVEIKSINSKQLDLIIRLPGLFRDQENLLRNLLSPRLERGKIDLTVSMDNLTGESTLCINDSLLKEYKAQIEGLIQSLNLPEPQDWIQVLFRMPDAFANKTPEAGEEETEVLHEACIKAAESLQASRLQEGKKLYEFFFEKAERIRELLKETEQFEENRVPKIRERLEQQLQKLESIEYDKGRLEQELIYYIEKLDVTEEKLRLISHIDYFEETLGGPDATGITGGKGKKLGFITQEMGREINTLGSKSNDAQMQKIVVLMKDELEQIKEQVLNVL